MEPSLKKQLKSQQYQTVEESKYFSGDDITLTIGNSNHKQMSIPIGNQYLNSTIDDKKDLLIQNKHRELLAI